jgi:TonB family protein
MRSLFLFLVAAALCAQDPTESRNALNQGVQSFRAAHYAEAVQSFQRAVAFDPSSSTARLYLATAYFQQFIPGADTPGNAQNAARAQDGFVQVLALDPQNKVALASLASLNLSQKRWDDAGDWYERLIAADSRNADAYYSLGFIAWSEWYSAYQQARTRLGMRQDAPGPIPDPVVRQDLSTRFGPLLEAGILNLQKALELNPRYDDAMAYMNLLIRERADLRDTPEDWRRDTAEANQWIQKALDTKKLKAQPAPEPSSGIRVGPAVLDQKLLYRVDPIYPALAAQARIQGIVRLDIVISKEGSVKNISVISGHPLLVPAALDAVKQWTYQPTLLNGAPVEVIMEAAVPFTLDPSVTVK